jgi:uncharacterized protein
VSGPLSGSLRGTRLAIALAAVVLVLVVLSRVLTTFYVDLLWFRGVDYAQVFLRTLVWVWGVRLVVTLAVAVFLYLNLRRVAAGLRSLRVRRRFGNLEIAEQLPARYVTGGVLALSALLALWLGAALPASVGRTALFYVSAEPWGSPDPFLGLDLSFYLFALPVLRAGVTFLLVVVFLALAVVTAGYGSTGSLRVGEGGVIMTEGARRHLGVLVAGFLLLLAGRLVLGMPLLLLFGSSEVQGIFGYTDHRASLRTLPAQATATALGALAVLFGAWRNRLVPVAAGIGVTLLATLGLGQLYPSLVQRFQVVPNELARETPYIEHALAFTRLGFGLDGLERTRFGARTDGDVDWEQAFEQFRGLPVWTAPTLLTTFREVEARFRYYDFPGVAIDRYTGPDGRPVPVAVAAREVDPAAIEEPNWQNLHLRERYVAGNGAVAFDISVSGRTSEARARPHLSGLPPEFAGGDSPAELELRRSAIFVGSRPLPPYAIIQPSESSYLAPDGSVGRAGIDFPGGIPVAGLFRKLVLAWHLREANVLFSSEVRPESRLVLRRGVTERVREIAPFLRFPEAPYPVVHDGRIVWVLEGFTATRFFPLATPFDLEFRQPVSYTRNSVKVTVDAVTGETRFYELPVSDPLRDTYARAYPGLFRPLDEMPETLRRHLRYSRTLMELQTQVLLQYHQDAPQTFFGQQDVWAVPQELAQSTQAVPYRAEYGLLRLPGDDEVAFHLITAFVPAGRQNLAALLAGELRPDGTFRLRLFDVPVENQVPGPRQVEALVEQDPVISQQFSLWRTGGSRVWTGHLHLVPVGDRIVYMEPVFLAAETDAIPELRRFVVSDGQGVVLAETLEAAVAAFAGRAPAAADAVGGAVTEEGATPSGVSMSAEALRLLDQAESRLREGDWTGFGEALERLRRLLRDATGGGDSG